MRAEDRIKEIAEQMQEDLVKFTQKVIQCPSLSGQEESVAKLYMEECRKLGYDEVFSDDYGNVIAVVKGNEDGPVIMYNGHLDHVDVGDKEEWRGYDPYGGVIDEAEMYDELMQKQEVTRVIHGRAAADTKSGMACQVYSGGILAQLKKEGFPVKGTYIYTGVVMEEPAEQIGMKHLMEVTFPERGIAIDGVVSCEATGLQLYLGHRGRVELIVEVEGLMSHASAPWLGVNAVYEATKLIKKVREYYEKHYREEEGIGRDSIALTIISCTPGAMSTVPDRCQLVFDRRFVSSETAQDCLEEMEQLIKEVQKEEPDFRASVRFNAVPRKTYTGVTVQIPNIKEAWKIEKDHPFVRAAEEALTELGEKVSYGYWDFGTDLATICGAHHIAGIGYSPMQEYYCHRPIDMVRIDFMARAVLGNVAIFRKLTEQNRELFAAPV